MGAYMASAFYILRSSFFITLGVCCITKEDPMAIKALLVGINDYPDHPLRGCVPDITRMRDVLAQHYGVGDDRMRILTDSAATQAGITDGLRWLAQTDDGES